MRVKENFEKIWNAIVSWFKGRDWNGYFQKIKAVLLTCLRATWNFCKVYIPFIVKSIIVGVVALCSFAGLCVFVSWYFQDDTEKNLLLEVCTVAACLGGYIMVGLNSRKTSLLEKSLNEVILTLQELRRSIISLGNINNEKK